MHTLFAFNVVQSGEGVGNEFLYIIAAIIGGIYSVYAVYGCGWTVILEGAFVTAMGYVIYAIVSPKLRYSAAQISTFPPMEKK